MTYCELSAAEQQRRRDVARHTRKMILAQIAVESEDDASVVTNYRSFFLQISFSELHPLMVFCLAKALEKPSLVGQRQVINELNLRSILGSHAINDEVGCYSYRATHWLDTEINPQRFYEMLDRCVDEANRGFYELTG